MSSIHSHAALTSLLATSVSTHQNCAISFWSWSSSKLFAARLRLSILPYQRRPSARMNLICFTRHCNALAQRGCRYYLTC